MSLRFIYGAAGSGKSSYCLENIKKRIEEGFQGNLILLVPEQFSFQSEKNLIKVAGEKSLFKAQVLSFKRMAHFVFKEVGGITKVHINSAGRNMLIQKVLEEVKGELQYFARAGRQKGFVNTISDTITELKRYNITPEILTKAEEEIGDRELISKIRDINLIYNKFEILLHEKYLDTEDEITLLYEKLDKSSFFNGAEIWIDEFSTFTAQQYSIIEKLLKKASRVNITLNMNFSCSEVFLPIRKTENKLLKIASDNNISLEKPFEINEKPYCRFKDSAELQHLEENLFSYPYKPYLEENKEICIYKALNEYTEVESAARSIITLCRERQARYKDIAVIVRDLGNYSNLIKVVFSQYNIPYFIDEKKEINRNPVIIMINSVIDIFVNNWSYEAVFAYLKTGLAGISKEEIDLLENYVLANGIKGKKWFQENWNYRINYNYEEEEIPQREAEIIEKVNIIREKIVSPIKEFQQNLRNSESVKEICENIYNFLILLKVHENLDVWIENFKESGENEKASEYAQVWNSTMDLLDQIVEVMGEEKIKLEDFSKLLQIGINEYKVGIIPPSLDQVLVGSMERVKSHEVAMVLILGANDGVFPKTSDSEGILSDRDRLNLKEHGVEIAQDTKSRALEEQYLIYTAFTIPKKYLRISYSISDFEGKALRPSIVISRIKKIFPKLKEGSDVINNYTEKGALEKVSVEKPTFNQLIYSIRSEKEGKKTEEIWKDVYSWYINNNNWKEKLERSLKGLDYSNQVSYVNSKKIKNLYKLPLNLSISRLEKFAECPFAYYVQYGLKAKQRKIYEFTAPDLGSFVHGVLDKFSLEIEENKLSWRELEENYCREKLSEIIEEEVNKKNGYILASSPRYRYQVERIKKLMTKSVTVISEHIKRGSFNPVGYEIEFGKEPQFPPLTIKLSSGETVRLTGRIDRLDEMQAEEGTYLRIIDYKSGSKTFKLSDVYYGLQLQLLVYLDAVLSNWGSGENSNNIPAAILYFKIDNPIISSSGESSEGEIEKEIMKKLKMQGLLLKDAKIIKDMDSSMERYSLIIPAQINQDGSLSGNTSAATREQFDILREYVRDLTASLCEDILQGKIAISPCKKKDFTACEYCEFLTICGFDLGIEGNKFNNMRELSDEEIFRQLTSDN